MEKEHALDSIDFGEDSNLYWGEVLVECCYLDIIECREGTGSSLDGMHCLVASFGKDVGRGLDGVEGSNIVDIHCVILDGWAF